MAYNGHNGVRYKRYDEPEGDDLEPECIVDSTDGTLDELYYEAYSGNLCVTVDVGDEYVSIEIPVKADDDWNEFVKTLPTWRRPE